MANRTTYTHLSGTVPGGGPTGLVAQIAERTKQLFDNSAIKLTAIGGTANAVTASLDPLLDGGGLVDGMKFTLTFGATNTGAMTLAINGGAALSLLDPAGTALIAGAVGAGLRVLIEYIGGAFRVLSPLLSGGAGGGAARYYWQFTASGTWTKPAGLDDDTMVFVEVWGGGGGGWNAAGQNGGGGGNWIGAWFRAVDLPSSVAVTIGAGGATGTPGAAGGTSSFGSIVTAFGGRASPATGQGGGGAGAVTGGSGRIGGSVGGGDGGNATGPVLPRDSTSEGGGGGGGASAQDGANAWRGGAGGGGGTNSGGISLFGGNGGAGGAAGVAPGGGGGRQAAGARGEVRVWI